MVIKIGPTFASELAAAGLAGAPCAWHDDGTYNIDGLTAQQRQTFARLLAAHDSTKRLPPQLTYPQFRALFTAAENQAIMTAAQSNHAVLDWLLQAVAAQKVNFADPQVKAGLDALVAFGLITAVRETAILANQPAPVA